jgi:hypothetical protein
MPLPDHHGARPYRHRPTTLDQQVEAALNAFDVTFDGRISAGRK